MSKNSLIALVALTSLFSTLSAYCDMPSHEELERELKGAGLKGSVHGAVLGYQQYVFTFREPGNFFNHLEFPLTTKNAKLKETLEKLTRHDQIIVKGTFLENHAPIKHINVDEIIMVKKYEGGLDLPKYKHIAQFPSDLENKTELIGKVHAIANEGKILVIEYKDAIVPVYVRDAAHTKNLYRNDKIKLKYTLRKFPNQPTHISLDSKSPNPIVVYDNAVQMHGKPGSITGTLVMFTKSPQVIFNVFALQHTDEYGVKREFTLVNFDDQKIFEKIRLKLQELWDTHPGNIVDARNKYLNLNLRLKATGTFNVVDPGQANPQILLVGPESVEKVD